MSSEETTAKKQGTARQILIIGCGTGNKQFLTRQASAALRSAQLFIGNRKLLAKMSDSLGAGRCVSATSVADIRRAVENAKESRIAILSEGDAGMGALEAHFAQLLDLRPVILPGISLISYVASRTGIPYGGAAFVDLRKKHASLLPALAGNRRVFAIGNPDMRPFFRQMEDSDFSRAGVYAVENPGEESERVFRGTVPEASGRDFSQETVFVFITPSYCSRGRLGLSSVSFVKESCGSSGEVRSAVLRSLDIAENDIVYCLGCGSGETAVEAAMYAASGIVYAIDRDQKLIDITKRNAAKNGIRNISVINGVLPDALGHLPAPDAALISCGGDKIRDLMQILVSRNPKVRITVQTGDMALAVRVSRIMEGMNFESEERAVNISEIEKDGDSRCLRPAESVFIISGKKREGIDHG